MSFKIIKSKNRYNVTKSFVNRFLKYDAFEHERPLNRRHIEELKKEISSGRGHVFNWAICYLEETNEVLRLDGQHSSNALAELFQQRGTVPDGLICNLDEYEADTTEDFVKLYNTFDTNTQTRTTTDQMRAAKANEPRLEPINPTHLHNIARAIMFYRNQCKIVKARIHREEKIRELLRNVEFSVYFNDLYRGHAKFMARYAIIAAMYAIWRVNKRESKEFWEKVRDGEDLKRSDPRLILREMLMQHSASARVAKPVNIASEQDQYAWCIYAWNHHRGRKMTRQKLQDMPASGKPPKPRK